MGSEIQKSGIHTKRVDQLAHNLVHVYRFNWEGQGHFGGFRWSQFHQKFEECHDLQSKNENKLYKNEMQKLT